MTPDAIVLPSITSPEFLSWILIAIGVVWIIYSLVATYHWITYSLSPLTGIIALAVYYLVSLALLGAMISFV